MGVFRLLLPTATGVALLATLPACSSREAAPTSEAELDSEPPRVPDPPPRYKRVQLDAGVTLPAEGESKLQIKCGGLTPYVCPLDDGTFRCNEYPCIPDCSRVGCVGGDVCLPCEGGYECVAAGGGC
jgi:hypothetical protein